MDKPQDVDCDCKGFCTGVHLDTTNYDHNLGGYPIKEEWPFKLTEREMVKRLLSRVEELEQDAARYRWLRDNCYVWGSDAMVRSDIQIEPAALWILGSVDMTEDGIDAAIDAAMREGKE